MDHLTWFLPGVQIQYIQVLQTYSWLQAYPYDCATSSKLALLFIISSRLGIYLRLLFIIFDQTTKIALSQIAGLTPLLSTFC